MEPDVVLDFLRLLKLDKEAGQEGDARGVREDVFTQSSSTCSARGVMVERHAAKAEAALAYLLLASTRYCFAFHAGTPQVLEGCGGCGGRAIRASHLWLHCSLQSPSLAVRRALSVHLAPALQGSARSHHSRYCRASTSASPGGLPRRKWGLVERLIPFPKTEHFHTASAPEGLCPLQPARFVVEDFQRLLIERSPGEGPSGKLGTLIGFCSLKARRGFWLRF